MPNLSISPIRAFYDTRMSPEDIVLLGIVCTHTDENGKCFPGLERLSAIFSPIVRPGKPIYGISSMSLKIDHLEECGYLVTVCQRKTNNGSFKSNDYKVVYDGILPLEFDRREIQAALQNTSVQIQAALESTSVKIQTNDPIERPNRTSAHTRKNRLVSEETLTNARSQSLHSGNLNQPAISEYNGQEEVEMQSDSMPTQIEQLFDEKPASPPPPPRSMEEIKAGIANACAEYEKKTAGKKRKGRAVADPYEQANQEQRYWAAQILSVMVDHPVAVDDMKTVALSSTVNDCVYKARNLMADLQAGRVTKEKLESAFNHLMNGGGERYRKMASVSANIVVTDVSNLCLKSQNVESASDRTMRALGLK